jgi:NitT/TauT family transport system substrate-binding protein
MTQNALFYSLCVPKSGREWEGAMLKRVSCAAMLVASLSIAHAEVTEITVAQQYGVSFLPLMVMEHDRVFEKHAKAAGLGTVTVDWAKVAGPSVMNDGLISGRIQFAAQGAPSLITLWDRTRDNAGVKGVAAMTTYPLYLISRNPDVKSIKDFGSNDKIAVPSIKISTQAIMLQMAAAAAFGDKDYAKLDPLTISLSHPDAALALANNTAGVNAHFSSSPFYEQEIKHPGVHLITTNYEILGGPATAVVLTSTAKFREANPKVYKAFYDALSEAIDIINKDRRAAAQLYLDVAKDTKNTVDDILQIINDKDYAYTLKPQKVFKTAEFMAKVGSIKQAPKSVEDLFFPEIAGLHGD